MAVFKYKVHTQGFLYSGEMTAESPAELRKKLTKSLGVEVNTQNLLYKQKRVYFSETGIGKPILSVFFICISISSLWFLVGLKIALSSASFAALLCSSQYLAGWNKARLELKTVENRKALTDSKKELKYLDVLDNLISSASDGHLTQELIDKLKERPKKLKKAENETEMEDVA